MFIKYKSELINLNHIVKIKKATSTNNRFANTDFYKLIFSLSNNSDLELKFDSEEELDKFMEKLEIIE